MRISQLFELIDIISASLDGQLPLIVGSQAIHAATNDPPEIALESIECDFLIFGGRSDQRENINKNFGILSPFQAEHGYYADALGLATVVLPVDWQERLVPLCSPTGKVVAKCLEIHDLAATKFAAGREKDHLFLVDALASGLVDASTFTERIDLLRSQVENDTIPDRLSSLLKKLRSRSNAHSSYRIIQKYSESFSALP